MLKSYFKKLNPAMIAVIWARAWPTMLEQAMQTAVQYIDTAMVGEYSQPFADLILKQMNVLRISASRVLFAWDSQRPGSSSGFRW